MIIIVRHFDSTSTAVIKFLSFSCHGSNIICRPEFFAATTGVNVFHGNFERILFVLGAASGLLMIIIIILMVIIVMMLLLWTTTVFEVCVEFIVNFLRTVV